MNRPAVICVDDEPLVLSALERTLGRESYRVLLALDGQEALELLERPAIKVVIADQRMPGMAGSELLSEIRKRRPEVGRIILTGYPGPEVMVRSLEAQVDFLMRKPWNGDELRRVIRVLIGGAERDLAAESG